MTGLLNQNLNSFFFLPLLLKLYIFHFTFFLFQFLFHSNILTSRFSFFIVILSSFHRNTNMYLIFLTGYVSIQHKIFLCYSFHLSISVSSCQSFLVSSYISWFISINLSQFISISVHFCQSVHIHLSSFLSIYLSSYISWFISINLSQFISISVHFCQSQSVHIHLSSFILIYLSSYLSISVNLYLSEILTCQICMNTWEKVMTLSLLALYLIAKYINISWSSNKARISPRWSTKSLLYQVLSYMGLVKRPIKTVGRA